MRCSQSAISYQEGLFQIPLFGKVRIGSLKKIPRQNLVESESQKIEYLWSPPEICGHLRPGIFEREEKSLLSNS
jgi:hypothetical protein